jgi:ribosome-associated protein
MSKHEDGVDEALPEGPSKSQVKREHLALQALAKRLTAMARSELEPLGLSATTRAAIDETGRIKDQRARRRHFKRIGKLLAREDMDAVHALVDEKADKAREEAARHHRVERWRERLIEEGDEALGELLDLCPRTDRQQLRQLMRAARGDREKGRPDAPRKLFRFLREIMKDTDLS